MMEPSPARSDSEDVQSGEQFQTAAGVENREPISGRVWTHPVVANGRLYLRDQELVFCYDVKAK